MARVDLAITIERPVPKVFAVLTTPELTPRWSANAIREWVTSEGPVGVGSTRMAVARRFGGGTTTNEVVVTEFERDRLLALRSISGPVSFTSAIAFAEVPEGTRVDWSWSFALPGIAAIAGPVFSAAFRRTFAKDLACLKAMMERGEL